LVGITLRLLFEWDGFATTEAVGHLVGSALAALLSWRGLTAGIVVAKSHIEYRGLLWTWRIRFSDLASVQSSGTVVPAGGPLYIGRERGVILVRRDGSTVGCTAVYGFTGVDAIVRRIQQEVRDRKKHRDDSSASI